MSKEKISQAQVGEMMKLASVTLRQQQGEIHELKEKVAHFEKRERVIKVANAMEEKGLEPELSLADKIEGLMQRDDLDVVEKAVGMTAPQMKLASVSSRGPGGADDEHVGSDTPTDVADQQFLANLASIGG